MTIDEITELLDGLDGVLTLTPGPGDGSPELSWGDLFFYYAPDGVVPKTQPFATIVTKDYPGDVQSRLDRPDTFRLNIAAGNEAFARWAGHDRREPSDEGRDLSVADTLFAHPVYGSLGWLAVVNPGPRTASDVEQLLRSAYELARSRAERRAGHLSD